MLQYPKFLLSGSSGFLGSIINEKLKSNGGSVQDISDVKGDFIDISAPFQLELKTTLQTVVHMAGKAHVVPRTEEESRAFFEVNLEGTKNLCMALENAKTLPELFVFISTVAVYGLETGTRIKEDVPLRGDSPYAKSKIAAEAFLQEWCSSKGISLLIFRLPLIGGPNPPGNLGKMINGIRSGKYLSINKGKAKRSVVLAEDIANCILNNHGRSGIYNLTDTYDPTFKELETVIAQQLNKKLPYSLPILLGRVLGKIGDILPKFPVDSDTITKMSVDLTFSSEKAQRELDWKPKKVLDHFRI